MLMLMLASLVRTGLNRAPSNLADESGSSQEYSNEHDTDEEMDGDVEEND